MGSPKIAIEQVTSTRMSSTSAVKSESWNPTVLKSSTMWRLAPIFLILAASASAKPVHSGSCHKDPKSCYTICAMNETITSIIRPEFPDPQCASINLSAGNFSAIAANAFRGNDLTRLTLQSPDCQEPARIELSPESLNHLEGVDSIRLDCVELSFSGDVPPDGSSAGSTAGLDQSTTGISGIPDRFFSHFPKLRTLAVYNIGVTTSGVHLLHQCSQQVEVLSLKRNNLTVIEGDAFRGFPELAYLEIVENGLTDLRPEMFNGLGKLMHLVLKDNRIGGISSNTFGGLQRLYSLALDSNEIREIGAGVFGDLRGVRWVGLAHNQLEEIPVNLTMFGSGGTLDLRGNMISRVDREDVGGFRSVKLHLRGIQVRHFEPRMFEGWYFRGMKERSLEDFSVTNLENGITEMKIRQRAKSESDNVLLIRNKDLSLPALML